jgi:hypothetical protein
MKDISTLILENGIKSLIYDSEESFKKSVINSLSLKLNDAINEAHYDTASTLMVKEENTNNSQNLSNFINFVENYDPKLNNKIKLKNESYINISENDFDSLVSLFNQLNTKNREIMLEEIFTSPTEIKRNIEFFNKTKGFTK